MRPWMVRSQGLLLFERQAPGGVQRSVLGDKAGVADVDAGAGRFEVDGLGVP